MRTEPFQSEKDKSYMSIIRWESQFPWLIAGITTREGGESRPPYDSFNCAMHVGDQKQDVIRNRKKLAALHQFEFDAWTCANQIHSANLHYVLRADRGKGKEETEQAIQDVDGLYTDHEDIFITSFYADCVPLFFLEPRRKMIGMAHAGWKGTAAQIGPKMVQTWQEKFNLRTENILVAIGPSIGGCCYEVDDRVIQQVQCLGEDMMANAVKPKQGRKYTLDLKQVNVELLKKAGIPRSNIEITGWCTGCHLSSFYSHRTEGGRTGRMTAYMAMKGETATL